MPLLVAGRPVQLLELGGVRGTLRSFLVVQLSGELISTRLGELDAGADRENAAELRPGGDFQVAALPQPAGEQRTRHHAM